MSDAEKAPWEQKFKEHSAAFAEFKKSGAYEPPVKKSSKKSGKQSADPDAPKKPSGGGYGVFLGEHREAIVKSLPAGYRITDVTKAAGAKWKALSEAEQDVYKKKFYAKFE